MNYTYYRRYQQPRRRRRRKKNQFSSFFWLVIFLVILAFILKACVSVITSVTEEKQDDIILTVERGGGEVLSFGQGNWEAATDLGVVLEGDSIRSNENSYLLLSFHNGPEVRLDESTSVTFDSVEMNETGIPVIHLILQDGQVWYEDTSEGGSSVVIHTDVMDVSGGDQFLLSNNADNESLYVFEGSVGVGYVDRGLEDVTLESLVFGTNTKSLITDEIERALLARESVILSELMEEGELSENDFVMWSLGIQELPDFSEPEIMEEEPEVIEEPEVLEEEVEVPVVEEEVEIEAVIEEVIETLTISVTSPSSGSSDDDGAIAIEGVISSGTAQSVYVTWSGNGQPYSLGLFEPGGTSFRYVADVNYSNFASGNNTYTVVAYDENGNESNTVSINILGDF